VIYLAVGRNTKLSGNGIVEKDGKSISLIKPKNQKNFTSNDLNKVQSAQVDTVTVIDIPRDKLDMLHLIDSDSQCDEPWCNLKIPAIKVDWILKDICIKGLRGKPGMGRFSKTAKLEVISDYYNPKYEVTTEAKNIAGEKIEDEIVTMAAQGVFSIYRYEELLKENGIDTDVDIEAILNLMKYLKENNDTLPTKEEYTKSMSIRGQYNKLALADQIGYLDAVWNSEANRYGKGHTMTIKEEFIILVSMLSSVARDRVYDKKRHEEIESIKYFD
jgi:hypothetical protein